MRMIEATSDDARTNGIARIGSQPIALATAALAIMLVGAGSITLWRAYTGASPEQERVVAARQVQARVAQASEQLVERTKALEVSQQEAITRSGAPPRATNRSASRTTCSRSSSIGDRSGSSSSQRA